MGILVSFICIHETIIIARASLIGLSVPPSPSERTHENACKFFSNIRRIIGQPSIAVIKTTIYGTLVIFGSSNPTYFRGHNTLCRSFVATLYSIGSLIVNQV